MFTFDVLSKKTKRILTVSTALVVSILSGFPASVSVTTLAQEEQDSDVAPAPPSIGADIPLTYFGPAPSEVNPSFIGPHQLLRSGSVDVNASTVTLPLYKGQLVTGETVWYVITDTTDKGINNACEWWQINYWSTKPIRFCTWKEVGRGIDYARRICFCKTVRIFLIIRRS